MGLPAVPVCLNSTFFPPKIALIPNSEVEELGKPDDCATDWPSPALQAPSPSGRGSRRVCLFLPSSFGRGALAVRILRHSRTLIPLHHWIVLVGRCVADQIYPVSAPISLSGTCSSNVIQTHYVLLRITHASLSSAWLPKRDCDANLMGLC